ncbi:GntR family transcriptional regulator [Nocardiopsis kunsanensis]|uniref:GntR family transcriptional regulator n=1 Tax=Nocardiopsis kunsanensis TaxID=141693 RepID=UPI00187600E6
MPKRQPYLRVLDDLRGQISSGELKAGDQLPSTRVLAERHDVAVMTARRAYGELQKLNLAEPTHGVGWFVVEPPKPRPDLEERVTELETEVRVLREQLAEHESSFS